MSNDARQANSTLAGDEDFRCPVCKAKQQLSSQCRRCQADLELVYRARLRLRFLLCQPRTSEVIAELLELAPQALSRD